MIILLNGTSSSGKTTTAKALLNQLPEPYFYFSVDQFLESSMPLTINMDRHADLALIDRAISGFNQSFESLSKTIDFMIIDHVLHKKEWLIEIAHALSDVKVFFVNVSAPLEIIERRESERPYRQAGTARAQYEIIQTFQHDLVVDTSTQNTDDIAKKIIIASRSGLALQASAKAIRKSC